MIEGFCPVYLKKVNKKIPKLNLRLDGRGGDI
jgi:hypothetical protein